MIMVQIAAMTANRQKWFEDWKPSEQVVGRFACVSGLTLCVGYFSHHHHMLPSWACIIAFLRQEKSTPPTIGMTTVIVVFSSRVEAFKMLTLPFYRVLAPNAR